MTEKVREASIRMVKELAEDLEYRKINYGLTLESLVQRTMGLLEEERKHRGVNA